MDEEGINLRKRVEYLEQQLLNIKDKYIQLLESKLAIGNEKKEIPTSSSVMITDMQLLFLLKESKATNKQYAVTATQLCKAYNIDRCVKTIRNKLNNLELHGLIGSIGLKPKCFFIAPSGLATLDRQRRSALTVHRF